MDVIREALAAGEDPTDPVEHADELTGQRVVEVADEAPALLLVGLDHLAQERPPCLGCLPDLGVEAAQFDRAGLGQVTVPTDRANRGDDEDDEEDQQDRQARADRKPGRGRDPSERLLQEADILIDLEHGDGPAGWIVDRHIELDELPPLPFTFVLGLAQIGHL